MNKRRAKNCESLLRLVRFLLWYGIAVAALLSVLPAVAVLAEQYYDALSNTLKLCCVLGVFAVVGAWHLLAVRDRR